MIGKILDKIRRKPAISVRRRGSSLARNPTRFQRGSVVTSGVGRESARAELQALSRSRAKTARLLLFSLGMVIAMVVIVTQTIYSPVVVVSGANGVGVDKYTTILADYFKANPVERIKMALNISSINSYIATLAPEIAGIESIATGFRRSEIRLTARRPVVMWESSGKKYYVDALGVPFMVNYFADPDVVVDDRSGVSLSSVDRVANDSFISFIGQAVAVANQANLVVKKIVIPPLTTRQIEIYVNDLQFPIKMTTSASVVKQVNDANRSIKYLQERGISPSYLDVRVERKTYYK